MQHFNISKDDDAYDFVTQVDGDIFVEHDVDDIEMRVRIPKCANGAKNMEGLYDEVVEGLDDIATALVDGFDGVDVNAPINQGEIVA
ncbi:hypothetical protein KIW84_045754 [Lathyrus oleraceus]|uniref:Uncharacterized protein n=1 Tax=Pisum sativum TaxID=3888 RepID=A0A9D4XL81_PEA|nr:hypothetical protein KIW84_045754 [Pisum sativum]